MSTASLLEVLRLGASIATPFAIAAVGLLINKTIQRQNAITQRQSSWLAKWADDFLTAASGFNDSATSFLMVWWSNNLKTINNMPSAEYEQRNLHVAYLPHWLALERWNWEMAKFAAFAPSTGNDLQTAADAINSECSSWAANKGGNVQSFREKQLQFNVNVRKMHAELLGLNNDSSRWRRRLPTVPDPDECPPSALAT